MQDFLREILQEEHEVEVAENGEQAWEAAQRQAPDLVLSDVRVPWADDIVFVRRLRAHPPTASVPIVLLTACGEERLRLAALAAGADDFLLKPFKLSELLTRLRRCLQLGKSRQAATEETTFTP